MRSASFVVALALALSACADAPNYEYDYDAYLGPHGHYLGPLEDAGHRPSPDCQLTAFSGPYYGGWRGPYVSGPYCAENVHAAAVPAASQGE
jgi:hypothetical protein